MSRISKTEQQARAQRIKEQKAIEQQATDERKALHQLYRKITLVSIVHGTTAPLTLEPYDREGTKFCITKLAGQRAYKKLCGHYPCLKCEDFPLMDKNGLQLELSDVPNYPQGLPEIVFVELIKPGQELTPPTIH